MHLHAKTVWLTLHVCYKKQLSLDPFLTFGHTTFIITIIYIEGLNKHQQKMATKISN